MVWEDFACGERSDRGVVVEGMGWMAVVVFDLPRVVDLRCAGRGWEILLDCVAGVGAISWHSGLVGERWAFCFPGNSWLGTEDAASKIVTVIFVNTP